MGESRLILFLSSIPLLLSVWTIDLAFVRVLHILLLFLFICSPCVYLCTWAVRELTLLFSHLQRQRNTKKVLHNSYHTLLSGLWPYSSPYLSGDRYAPHCLHTADSTTPRQPSYNHPHSHTFKRCSKKRWLCTDSFVHVSINVSLMLTWDHCVADRSPSLLYIFVCFAHTCSTAPSPIVHSLGSSSCSSFPFPSALLHAAHPPSFMHRLFICPQEGRGSTQVCPLSWEMFFLIAIYH